MRKDLRLDLSDEWKLLLIHIEKAWVHEDTENHEWGLVMARELRQYYFLNAQKA